MNGSNWKNKKAKLVVSWIINTPNVYQSAWKFALDNPSAPILYRASLRAEEMQEVVTPDGISAFDPELHFGELSDVLWTFTA